MVFFPVKYSNLSTKNYISSWSGHFNFFFTLFSFSFYFYSLLLWFGTLCVTFYSKESREGYVLNFLDKSLQHMQINWIVISSEFLFSNGLTIICGYQIRKIYFKKNVGKKPKHMLIISSPVYLSQKVRLSVL